MPAFDVSTVDGADYGQTVRFNRLGVQVAVGRVVGVACASERRDQARGWPSTHVGALVLTGGRVLWVPRLVRAADGVLDVEAP